MTPCAQQLNGIMQVMETAFDPAFGEAWNRRQVSDALTLPSTHALLIDTAGELITGTDANDVAGFVLTRHAADEEELLLIAVRPEDRRRGLGDRLIAFMFDEAKKRGTTKVFLEMRRNNPAEQLYRKVGFTPIGERSDYYLMNDGSRVDAITFGYSL